MDKQNTDQDERTGSQDQDKPIERQPFRRNPRIVIGTLDYFELIMEQDEEG